MELPISWAFCIPATQSFDIRSMAIDKWVILAPLVAPTTVLVALFELLRNENLPIDEIKDNDEDNPLCRDESTDGDENAVANFDILSSPTQNRVATKTADRSDTIFDIFVENYDS